MSARFLFTWASKYIAGVRQSTLLGCMLRWEFDFNSLSGLLMDNQAERFPNAAKQGHHHMVIDNICLDYYILAK